MKNNPIQLGIFGASGKFGKAIALEALQNPQFLLKGLSTHRKSPHVGMDLGSLLGKNPIGLSIQTSFEKNLDLWIDVSLQEGFQERLSFALEQKTPLIIGTTNLSFQDFEKIDEASLQIPIFYAPNFSLGMAILRYLGEKAAQKLPQAEIDLVETHHKGKKDAPSGSALMLKEALRKVSDRPIAIQSLRLSSIVGEHTLHFHFGGETLSLSHQAHSRAVFAQGALQAACFLMDQRAGLYGMKDLLK